MVEGVFVDFLSTFSSKEKVEAHLALRQYFKQKTPLIIKAFLNIIENYDLIRIQSPAEDE